MKKLLMHLYFVLRYIHEADKKNKAQYLFTDVLLHMEPNPIKQAAICAGVGIGVDSGFGVFKDVDAVYQELNLNLKYEDLACPKMLGNRPDLFLGFMCTNYNQYRSTPLHKGYEILLKWAKQFEENQGAPSAFKPFFVYTSNIDGHFKKIGFQDEDLVEIHGSLMEWQCRTPHMCSKEVWTLDLDFYFEVNAEARTMKADKFPKCKNCNKRLIRPHVMMFFDETYATPAVDRYAGFTHWERQVAQLVSTGVKVAILEIGCGILVPTVRSNWPRAFLP